MEKALRYNEGKRRLDLVPFETLKIFSNLVSHLPNLTSTFECITSFQKGKDTNDTGIYYIDILGAHILSELNSKSCKDLLGLDTESLNMVADVFTMGAKKYSSENWKKGLSWLETFGSFLRHYRAYLSGELYDAESGLHHLGHALVNLIFIRQFYHLAPWHDDRLKAHLIIPRIVLDIDDVIADFIGAYKKRYNIDKDISQWYFSYKTSENLEVLEKDKDFWVNLEVLHYPNFIPLAYVSSRQIPIEWTEEFLEKNNLPCRKVYHVGYKESKVEILKSIDCQLFIDDKIDNVVEAQRAGICSYLLSNSHNEKVDVGIRRLHDLNIHDIVYP